MRLVLLSSLALWPGATLLLSTNRWIARRPLAERLRPYVPGGFGVEHRPGLLTVDTFREVIGPLATSVGSRIGRLFGVNEDVGVRLRRTHADLDVTAFRVRQLGWAVAVFGIAGLATIALRLPPAAGALVVIGAPLLAFLVLEQSLARASAEWQRHLFLELPVVSEQLGMLLSAGYSMGAALNRIAQRGSGCVGRDLARVTNRIRQGQSEVEALREWADLAAVPAVDRLVQVLALNRHAGDLGRLIAEEARSIRRDVHRQLIERIERREQQVWIPVTVATLLPGVIFLAVPFIQAMRLFAGQ